MVVVVVTVVVTQAVVRGRDSGDWECLRWGTTPPTPDTVTAREEEEGGSRNTTHRDAPLTRHTHTSPLQTQRQAPPL